jgi:membrane protein DedA with SNARE-associated domain
MQKDIEQFFKALEFLGIVLWVAVLSVAGMVLAGLIIQWMVKHPWQTLTSAGILAVLTIFVVLERD